MNQDVRFSFVVNRLCSTWPLADGLVQFEEPKMTSGWFPAAASCHR